MEQRSNGNSVLELNKMITILAGGTGSVKLVRGVASQRNDVNVIN